jgi:hypothetical protein
MQIVVGSCRLANHTSRRQLNPASGQTQKTKGAGNAKPFAHLSKRAAFPGCRRLRGNLRGPGADRSKRHGEHGN